MSAMTLKNRIATYFTIVSAIVIVCTLLLVYGIVSYSVYSHLDQDLLYEASKHRSELVLRDRQMVFRDLQEWMEREHRIVEVNPVFVQVLDSNSVLMDRSPNLKHERLLYQASMEEGKPFNTYLANRPIRQVQQSIAFNGKIYGSILVAMPLEDALMVLNRLSIVLWSILPIAIILTFILARSIVGRSILPITQVIETAREISAHQLDQRIPVPERKDELQLMVQTINQLLDRISLVLKNEKQFTSSVSHELRNPLAVIKGSLEVLIRKERAVVEYEEVIQKTLQEIARMELITERMLLLARSEQEKHHLEWQWMDLRSVLENVLINFNEDTSQSEAVVHIQVPSGVKMYTDQSLFETVCINLWENTRKHAVGAHSFQVLWNQNSDKMYTLSFEDDGEGVAEQELSKLTEAFYSVKHSKSSKGSGLGLALVSRICRLLNYSFKLHSKEGLGFKVELFIPKDKVELKQYSNV